MSKAKGSGREGWGYIAVKIRLSMLKRERSQACNAKYHNVRVRRPQDWSRGLKAPRWNSIQKGDEAELTL